MKNIELLAPAGSFEAFIAAIQNGANAVYLGGNEFSARAFATNFTNDEIVEAVKYAHLRNVRVFVTVNTLYEDEKFPALYEYISFLYDNNVDAVIIQDIGLLHMVKQSFPDFEVHMSTQASIYNKETARYYQELGVDRIVLARENNIEEIKEICLDTSMDVEVFVHGALCMGYSGQCLFSSFLNDRSGNKGSCSQPCRLPYRLKLDNKDISKNNMFLLSPKDLCTIGHVEELILSGIHSFKIEGRMKRPEYVATIVQQYRQAIDAFLNKKAILDTQEKIYKMKTMFNRGFTGGHIFHEDNLLSGKFSGNKGIEVGKVVGYSKATRMLSIQLVKEIKQNDRILFHSVDLPRTITKLYYQGNLVNSGKINQTVQIEMNHPIQVGEVVYRIYDIHKIKEAHDSYQKENINIPISMKFFVDEEFPVLELTYDDITVSIKSTQKIEKALKTELSSQRIEMQLNKLGNTVYHLKKSTVQFPEGYTFSIKALNEMRRVGIDKLSSERESAYQRNSKFPLFPIMVKTKPIYFNYVIKVSTIQQLQTTLKYNIKEIFFPLEGDINKALRCFDEQKHKICFYTNFLTSKDSIINLIESGEIHRVHKVMVADMRAYQLLKDYVPCVLDSNHNIYNSYALDHLSNLDVVLSKECTDEQILNLQFAQKTYMYVYGYMEAMVLKHCMISNHYFGKKAIGCNACKKGDFSVSDGKNSYPLLVDSQCNNHLYHYRPLVKKNAKQLGVTNAILDFTFENESQIIDALKSFSIL